jgi:plastocyanin
MKGSLAATLHVALLTAAAVAAGIGVAEPSGPALTISLDTVAPYYDPFVAVVPAGAPIRWVNPTASPHSVRHDGCLRGDCAFQSVALQPDESFMIAPLPPGRYDYHCELHPIMRGTVVVLGEAAAVRPSSEAHATAR